MSFDPVSSLLEAGLSVISKIWPDPIKQAEEERKLIELSQNGSLAELDAHVKLMLKQAEINLADAKSGKGFQANWRPMIGWVGAISLGLMYIPKALVMTSIWTWQCFSILSSSDNPALVVLPIFPDLGVTDIIGLLMSMLGVAAIRSYDKKNKIDTK
tara:strand:+ start:170 stop:640 length:471 start_codon:yes stop_codon:yes gene_type:complete